jgi:hypothetical protein
LFIEKNKAQQANEKVAANIKIENVWGEINTYLAE